MCSKEQGFYSDHCDHDNDSATMINSLAIRIHKQNCDVGWWDDPNRDIFETLMLVITEIAEAVEGERKNLMDDHLPHRKMAEVELADTLIRLLDLAGKHNWGYVENDTVKKVCREDLLQAKSIGAKYLILTARVVQLANFYEQSNLLMIIDLYVQTVQMVIELASEQGYNLIPAVQEKLEYKVKAMTNEHGLDADYFKKKLKLVERDAKMYTPDEMFNELSRLMMVAASQANLKVKLTVEPN